MTSIAMIVGSLRKESLNRKLAQGLAALAPDDVEFTWPDIGRLPLYNQDQDADQSEPAKALKAAIRAADAVIFVTPEYNRSFPGVLKNALDHASRPFGDSAWAGKPAGIIGISPGAMSTAMAQQHLRNVLAALDMPTLGQPEVYLQYREGFFDEDGAVSEQTRTFIRKWLTTFLAFVGRHSG